MVATKFPFGQVVATPGAFAALSPIGCQCLLRKHGQLDPGDLCEADIAENAVSLREGFRILSSYDVDGTKYWVITEADRSSTTVLLPEEY